VLLTWGFAVRADAAVARVPETHTGNSHV